MGKAVLGRLSLRVLSGAGSSACSLERWVGVELLWFTECEERLGGTDQALLSLESRPRAHRAMEVISLQPAPASLFRLIQSQDPGSGQHRDPGTGLREAG